MKANSLFNQTLHRLCAALSVLICTACNSAPQTAPIEKPFGLGRGDESVEFDFRVKEEYGYDVDLKIFANLVDQKEWDKLRPQLGDRIFADGSTGDVGAPITLRVRLQSISVKGSEVKYDQTTDKIPFINTGPDFASKRVIHMLNDKKLQPGTYRIRIDNLHSVPEFADRIIHIFVRPSEQGK